MKCVFTILVLLLTLNVYSETPSFIPRTNNTGSIGTIDKQWGTGYFSRVYFDGEDISNYVSSVKLTSFNGSTGNVQIIGGDDVTISTTNGVVTISISTDPSFEDLVGTNRVYFNNVGNVITYPQVWQSPKDGRIRFWVWGASGGGRNSLGGAGGFSQCTINATNGQWFTLVTGESGYSRFGTVNGQSVSIQGGWPAGGTGTVYQGSTFVVGGGGGRSQVLFGYFTDITNVSETIVVAGGGGGSGHSASGGDGGGLVGEDGVGTTSPGTAGTQTSGGVVNGDQFEGGDSTNLGGRGAGGGGDGWYGGGAANLGAVSTQSGGGSGSGYISTHPSVVRGFTYRGINLSPIGSELPEYISGAGIPSSSASTIQGGGGLIVIGY